MSRLTLNDNALRIVNARYSRKDDRGNPTESWDEIVKRVAWNVAITNALYAEQGDHVASHTSGTEREFPWRTARRMYDWMVAHAHPCVSFPDGHGDGAPRRLHLMLAEGWHAAEEQEGRYEHELLFPLLFLPNSPTWTGAGTPLGQLSACFVLPIADDLALGRDSIFETLRVAGAIQQTGGGNGFSFSRLRPEGDVVKRSMGRASGPVKFLEGYNHVFATIAQGGARRGANMADLLVHHPDIGKFIAAKVEEGRLAEFNISVCVTDEFMEAVEQDKDFDLHFGGKVYETVRARALFEEITESAWKLGDPGNLFVDVAERSNPCPARYRYESTNPCGEQWLPPYGSCNLGSIAISRHVKEWYTATPSDTTLVDGFRIHHGVFDWDAFRDTIVLATQFLDDVVDANQYVLGVPEIEDMAMNERRIGLGGMGLADAMVMMGIRYGSPEGEAFAAQVTEWMRYWSMWASIERAKARGPFPWIEGSIYDPRLLREHGDGAAVIEGADGQMHKLWKPPDSGRFADYDFGRPTLEWAEITLELVEHGIRNATTLTYAPTGAISNVAMLEGSGCEPLFALAYDRTLVQAAEGVTLQYNSALFEEALRRAGIGEADRQEIAKKVAANRGSCRGVAEVPAHIRHAMPVAADLTAEQHVRMQAACQAFVDNSVSKTVNFPNAATVEDVRRTYKLAYALGCKGITIYRQGSRSFEILRAPGSDPEVVEWPVLHPLPIPDYAREDGLEARVIPVETFFGKVQVTITELRGHEGRPFDVRLQIGKGGSDKNADVEALGRMISIALRTGLSVEHVVEQLEHIGGANFHGFGENKVRSVADGVAKLLRRKYLGGNGHETVTSATGSSTFVLDRSTVCPTCGQATVVIEAGCKHCEPKLGGCGLYNACD